jgi:hypothetical protein
VLGVDRRKLLYASIGPRSYRVKYDTYLEHSPSNHQASPDRLEGYFKTNIPVSNQIPISQPTRTNQSNSKTGITSFDLPSAYPRHSLQVCYAVLIPPASRSEFSRRDLNQAAFPQSFLRLLGTNPDVVF